MRTHHLGPSLSSLLSQGEGAVCFLTEDVVEVPQKAVLSLEGSDNQAT